MKLTREDKLLAARFLFELLELQGRGASEEEINAWRARVEQVFPGEHRESFIVTVGEILRAKGADLERILGVAA